MSGGYLTLREAAERLGESEDTVKSWIEQRTLAGGIDDDGTVAVLARDVEALRAELYGVPDLVFDTPDDPIPPQI